MKLSPVRIIALAFGAAFASCAYAGTITDTITLIDSNGSTVDGTGSFTYDTGADLFTQFSITWGTETYNFLTAANGASTTDYGCDGGATIGFVTFLTDPTCQAGQNNDGRSWQAADNSSSDSASAFGFVGELDSVIEAGSSGTNNGIESQFGTFNVSSALSDVPEPSSMLLVSSVLLALACLGRKRKAEPTL